MYALVDLLKTRRFLIVYLRKLPKLKMMADASRDPSVGIGSACLMSPSTGISESFVNSFCGIVAVILETI